VIEPLAETAARMERGTRALPWILGGGAMVSFVAALVDVERIAAPQGGRPLQPTVGLVLLLYAASLALWLRGRALVLARSLAVLLALLGVLGLIKHVVKSGTLSADATTSLVFAAAGVGLALFDKHFPKRGNLRVAEVAGLVAWAAVLTAGFDWLLNVVVPPDAAEVAAADAAGTSLAVSPYTFALMALAAVALFTARPREGWMAVLTADTATAREALRLVRALPIIIMGVSLVRFVGEHRGLYDGRYGVALMVGAMTFVLVAVCWRTLRALQNAEAEALRGRAVLDAIVENIPHMIFVKDGRELRFVRFNAAGERLLGMKREELIGKNDFDFFPKEQAEFFQAKDRATLALARAGNVDGAKVDILEEQIDTKNGKRWLHTVKVPVEIERGTPPFLLGISEDITARKAAEDELRRAKESAESTSKELEAFSYSVSHDLRAPLRSIDGFSLAVIEDAGDKLDEDNRKNLERVRAAAQKMATLIDDLLNLSRVSRQALREEPVDLTAIAEGIVAELRRADPTRQVEVTIARDLKAVGDPRLIEVMLQNLIGNAWKFTRKKSVAHIEVGAVEIDGERRFFVKDDGAGFDMDYVNKLFGAFQRLHGASEFEGTGIGLATVQRIAHRHGGQVWAEGAVEQGARFTFRLGKTAAGL
jgi:PAS domain S-box-containing protein